MHSRIQLEPDDTLLLFSDGVSEAEDKDLNSSAMND